MAFVPLRLFIFSIHKKKKKVRLAAILEKLPAEHIYRRMADVKMADYGPKCPPRSL